MRTGLGRRGVSGVETSGFIVADKQLDFKSSHDLPCLTTTKLY